MGYYLTTMQVNIDTVRFDEPIRIDEFNRINGEVRENFDYFIQSIPVIDTEKELGKEPVSFVMEVRFKATGERCRERLWDGIASAFAERFFDVTGHAITGNVVLYGESVFDIRLGTFADGGHSTDRGVVNFPNAEASFTYGG